jgi:hypothetical protein
MKPKAEESNSIPPPMAIRYPATGTVPASALRESGGAAVNVRADRDGGDSAPAGGVAADGDPTGAVGAGIDPWPATLPWDGTFSTPEPVTTGRVSAEPALPSTGPGAAGSSGDIAEDVGAGEGGPRETQNPPAAAGTCLSGQGAALAGIAKARTPAATKASTARTQRTSRPLHMPSNATLWNGFRPANRSQRLAPGREAVRAEKRPGAWPPSASSASTRPIAGVNLKPCPEKPAPTTTGPKRSSTKSSLAVLVYVQLMGTADDGSTPGSHSRAYRAYASSCTGSGVKLRASGSVTGPTPCQPALMPSPGVSMP